MSSDGKGMRAVILVGGFGTRLRPLTLTKPKPLVPFCNKPMIIHQVEALHEAGVTEVILAVAYRPEAMKAEMDDWAKKIGVTLVFSLEKEPLGTAGPLALAKDILLQDDEPFFVLNSDVTCRFPLQELLAFHKSHGREGTVCVTKVTDWEKYGVVVFDESSGAIQQFVEKPKTFVGDRINAGIYIFNKQMLERIPERKCSIEKEIFPQMARDKNLFAFNLVGFWKDIGQPRDFIEGMVLFITSLLGSAHENDSFFHEKSNKAKCSHFTVRGCAMIDPSAKIGEGCLIGPNASIGRNCVIGPHCRIDNAAVFENTTVGGGSYISQSIIGWNNRIGRWCHVQGHAVLGDDVDITDGTFVAGVKVLPNKGVSKNYYSEEIIM